MGGDFINDSQILRILNKESCVMRGTAKLLGVKEWEAAAHGVGTEEAMKDSKELRQAIDLWGAVKL
jgi:hypothetical protein